MSPEKPSRNLGSQKQKIMIGVIIVALAGVAYELFGTGGSSTPTPSPTPAGKPMTAGGPGMPQQQASIPPPEMVQPKPAVVPVNAEILKLQQQTQADYLSSVTKLQMLKIQREIDETKTAIANAELSRMTAEKSIADLITSKENNTGGGDMGPITGGGQISPFGLPPQQTTPQPATPPPSMVVQAVPQIPLEPYSVLSVAYQGHKWTAVMSLQGKTMNVVVGDVLDDGSTIVSISRNRVILKRDNRNRTLDVATNNI